MCVNGDFLLALEVMNVRWDYRGRRLMSVMKMVDGVMSMGMMLVVEMVISCHSFLHVRCYFLFGFFKVFIAFGLWLWSL